MAIRSKVKKIVAIAALALTVSACGGAASAPSVAHSQAAKPTVTAVSDPTVPAASPAPTASAASPVGTWDVTYGAPAVVSINVTSRVDASALRRIPGFENFPFDIQPRGGPGAQGGSNAQVAAALGRDAHTVGSWLADFRQHGPAALAFAHTGGSPPP